jgi:hypothetical protein
MGKNHLEDLDVGGQTLLNDLYEGVGRYGLY